MKSLASCFRRISTRNRLSDLLEAMPKDTTQHIERNQKQRLRIKEKSKFYSPGTVSLQILGSGSRGTSASIYLFSEQSRYGFSVCSNEVTDLFLIILDTCSTAAKELSGWLTSIERS